MCKGSEIRERRQEKGLSVRKLAQLSKVSHAYISRIENGFKGTEKILVKIEKALDQQPELSYEEMVRRRIAKEDRINDRLNYILKIWRKIG